MLNCTRHIFASDDYETAKKWSKKAAVQSSLESGDDAPKRKRRAVCLSSSDEGTNLNISSPPRPQKKSRLDCKTTDAVTETGRWAFPLPLGVFQKKVLSLLVDIRHRLK
ncbi:hypothetical protein G5714_002655 [Onychostoma macrolepis]|uniref:Uncharacterized protein n=1 Tax=Onychostoma macrolepis TaxID=369639 RepID=A0A7J6D7B4_9TELE|nr:hypothetical protein G5714_002655 [Onychostoma macrolepis]